jgi:beta-fructofuranosidase
MTTDPSSRHRPRHHLSARYGWLNDPNGPIRHDGVFHLFAQHNPEAPLHAHVHWAHWVSRDLAVWTEAPVALSPRPGKADEDGCWSGSAIELDGEIVLIYSGYRVDEPFQSVCIARPDGDGLWVADDQPVLWGPPDGAGAAMMRDPFVRRVDDGYQMVIGSGDPEGRPNALVFSSPDLMHWRFLGTLCPSDDPVVSAADSGAGWECPQLLVRGDRAALIVSAWSPPGLLEGVRWLAGRWDGVRLTPSAAGLVDYGPDYYAADLVDDEEFGAVSWAWAWEARDQSDVDVAGWAGLLTCPRLVTLDDDGLPVFQPVSSLTSLRRRMSAYEAVVDAGVTTTVDAVAGRSLDVEARLAPRLGGIAWLRVLADLGGSEYTEIGVDASTGVVYLDRDRASVAPTVHGGRYELPVRLDAGGGVDIRILVDVSIVEVFAGGRSITARVYPDGDASVGLLVGANEAPADVSLTWWELADPA